MPLLENILIEPLLAVPLKIKNAMLPWLIHYQVSLRVILHKFTTLPVTELEFNARDSGSNAINSPPDATPKSPSRATSVLEGTDQQEKLSRLHDIFQYRSSTGRTTPGLRTSLG